MQNPKRPKLKKLSLKDKEPGQRKQVPSLKGIKSIKADEIVNSVTSRLSYKELIKSQEKPTFNFKKKLQENIEEIEIINSVNEMRIKSVRTHKLQSIKTNRSDDQLRAEDIRKEIEETYDVGREIECLSQPIDDKSAQVIIDKESLNNLFKDKSLIQIYASNSTWKQFGEGIYLLFSFLQIFALVFLILGLIGVSIVALNIKGGRDNSSHQTNIISLTSYANLKEAKSVNFVRLKEFLSNFLQEEIVEEVKDVGSVDIMKENTNLKTAIEEEYTKEEIDNRLFLDKRFTIYLCIDSVISLLFLAAIIGFHIWVFKFKHKILKKKVTIKNFCLQISPLEGIDLETSCKEQFLYNNKQFWDKKEARREPHSVHTFYKQKQQKNKQAFFGEEFTKMETITQSEKTTTTNLTSSQVTESHQLEQSTGKFFTNERIK